MIPVFLCIHSNLQGYHIVGQNFRLSLPPAHLPIPLVPLHSLHYHRNQLSCGHSLDLGG